jgi:exonuclease III
MQKLVRKKKGHYKLIKGSIQQEDKTIPTIDAPNTSASKFIKQTILSLTEEIDPDTMIVGDLNFPLSSIDRISWSKFSKDILELKNTVNEIDLTDICRLFHHTAADYPFFSATHGTFSKIDHILSHKANHTNTQILK